MASPSMTPRQGSLLDDVQHVEKPWKTTTGTSRESVRLYEQTGDPEALRRVIPIVIRALWNRMQQSPTSRDIAVECAKRGLIEDDHPDHVKPRLTELDRGYWVVVKDADGRKVKVHRGGGLIEKAGTRKCWKTGKTVHTWRVVERGTGSAVRP